MTEQEIRDTSAALGNSLAKMIAALPDKPRHWQIIIASDALKLFTQLVIDVNKIANNREV